VAGEAVTRVWDLPTRVFHWLLAALVVFSWCSGQFGGSDWRDWHFRSGYAVLALLLFRIVWGFTGPRYARFASFPPSPRAALGATERAAVQAGHSPLGGLSVYAMLICTLAQVVAGLFATDDSYSEGPLARFVSDATVHLLTRLHSLNRWLLLGLVLLHIGAIIYYAAARGQNLTAAMLHGDRPGSFAPAAQDDIRVRVLGVTIAVAAMLLVAWLVML
jgi:cytochrome b